MAARPSLRTLLTVLVSVVALGASAASVYGVVRLAARERSAPARCGPGLVELGARCCAPGQTVQSTRCVGRPTACPIGMFPGREDAGCVRANDKVRFRGGQLELNADDWQAEGLVAPRSEAVAPFALDSTEVTVERWSHCAHAGSCPALPDTEPGVPVTRVEARDAERFCRFASGRLPTSAEWLLAAHGLEGRRFAWGATGLVCRRVAFGLASGPCAHGGGPELAGSRPDGTSPEGLLDLSGNAAEWTLEPDGSYTARGGSYRSEGALELTTWAVETPGRAMPWVGFRCAYDVEPPAPSLR